MFSKTLEIYILSIISLIENKIQLMLFVKFGLMFYEWTNNKINYVEIFCTYVHDGKYCKTHIASAPLLEEGDLCFSQHADILKKQLSVYGKSQANVACLSDDNCSVNERLLKLTVKPLIGSYRNKFNLVLEHWLQTQSHFSDALQFLRALFGHPKTREYAAHLFELTRLGSLIRNDTH